MVLVSLTSGSFKKIWPVLLSVLFISFFPEFFTAVIRISLAQARTVLFDEVKIVTHLSLYDAR